jgi:hypothetical protein
MTVHFWSMLPSLMRLPFTPVVTWTDTTVELWGIKIRMSLGNKVNSRRTFCVHARTRTGVCVSFYNCLEVVF